MNVHVIAISICVALICILTTLLQHYYFLHKKTTAVKLYEPHFEDLIADEERNNIFVDLEQYDPAESEVLKSLHSALELQLARNKNLLNLSHKEKTANVPLSELEVQNSLNAALAFKLSGKPDKALRLFEHAASLAPDNPDVLTRYGEFLEQTQHDIISADQLYFKALSHSPNHRAALTNRARTAHVVDQLDMKMFRAIDQKRDLLKSIPDSNAIFQRVKRQAYYLHIYHTVGIEGNTLTLEQLRYLLETGRAVAGKSIMEHNEVIGLQLAMKYVKILSRVPSIGIKEILGIHRRVMGHVDPLSSGQFRSKQVFVGSHVPPAPQDMMALMEGYVEWFNSEEAASMHPVRYAALAHYKLVDIHPFEDGNGRTSRLIMNLILLRAGYPPIIILKEHRKQYYEYLQIANKGDVRPFVRFIAQCTEQILDLYLWGAREFAVPSIGHDNIIAKNNATNKSKGRGR